MISSELQKAIDTLHIYDVYQRELTARCHDEFDPKIPDQLEKLSVQIKHHVRQSQVIKSQNSDDHLLRVFVEVAARWMQTDSGEDDSKVKASIEAVYIAEYTMDEFLEQPCIDEFSLKNVSYHIWPYWREQLSSQCDRMELPKVILPVMQLAHNRRVNEEQTQ